MKLSIKNYTRIKAHNYVQILKNSCADYFSDLNYIDHPPIAINSGIDPTVRFIGSHISVFKQYIIKNTIPNNGYFIIQDCIRTQNSEYLYNDDSFINWASYFPSFGIIAPPQNLEKIVSDVFNFLLDELDLTVESIKVRISKKDNDLVRAINRYTKLTDSQIEFNTKPDIYYTHKLGMNNLAGRNFNIALRDSNSNSFSDIGNIIMLENHNKPVAVEVALGITMMLRQILKLQHVLDCFSIIGIQSENLNIRRKFEDTILVCIYMARVGLKPSATDNKDRLYRKYLRSMSYFRAKTNMSMDTLENIIFNFELKEFQHKGESNLVYKQIISYLTRYEAELDTKSIFSKEDSIIHEMLNMAAIKERNYSEI